MMGHELPSNQSDGLLTTVPVKPIRSYIIATAPRTGSSLLSEALTTTRRAGRPDEFFDASPTNEAHWAKLYGVPEGDGYLDGIVAASSTTNGVFGCKLHWHQLPALRARLAQAIPVGDAVGWPDERPVLELLAQRLPGTRFVWLSRRNKVAQAISYYRAAQSGIWRTFKDNRHGDAGPAQIPDFDRAAIAHYVRTVEQMDAGWRQFFNHHKIPAVVVVYEDLIKFYTPTIRGVLKYLDLPYTDVLLPEPNIQRLSDAESDEWERRFRAGPPPVRRAETATTPAEQVEGRLPMTAYDVGASLRTMIVPGGPGRAWMDATYRRYAYRCLPMVIANQWGWLIKLRQRVEAIWDGTDSAKGLVLTSPGQPRCLAATSMFGSGILTFHIGYLFRTPPGFNMHVRGPANWPKDGISALEGIVETDWTESTFTMNWKVTRPNHRIVFEAGDPIAMISPVRRGEMERFAPEIRPLADDPELEANYRTWAVSRDAFNVNVLVAGSPEQQAGWQKDYVRGRNIGGSRAPEHQTAIGLTGFDDKR